MLLNKLTPAIENIFCFNLPEVYNRLHDWTSKNSITTRTAVSGHFDPQTLDIHSLQRLMHLLCRSNFFKLITKIQTPALLSLPYFMFFLGAARGRAAEWS